MSEQIMWAILDERGKEVARNKDPSAAWDIVRHTKGMSMFQLTVRGYHCVRVTEVQDGP